VRGQPWGGLKQASISASLENLLTFPYVAAAVQSGALVLHGAYFDLATGQGVVREGGDYRVIVESDLAKA
jgi:carbonic anhydrase